MKDLFRIAAISDVHYGKSSEGLLRDVFQQINEVADVLLICGDLTDYGLPEEAQVLATDLKSLRIPVLSVLGNHDFESNCQREVREVMEEAGVRMLDGECTTVDDVGFAGVRGFAGGFGKFALNAWGEAPLKQFVKEAVDESLKLETALNRLQTAHKVALIHYSPIRTTVEGEPTEIWPFLGSSRLEDPLNHYEVAVAFHGHAHNGHPEGQTSTGIPVYNVAVPVLRKNYPDQAPFRLFELKLNGAATEP